MTFIDAEYQYPRISQHEIDAIVLDLYPELQEFEGVVEPEDRTYMLLSDVAARYLQQLEQLADGDPAPFFDGRTPLEALLDALRDNLRDAQESHVLRYAPPHIDGWEREG